jgi:hypothetical protein
MILRAKDTHIILQSNTRLPYNRGKRTSIMAQKAIKPLHSGHLYLAISYFILLILTPLWTAALISGEHFRPEAPKILIQAGLSQAMLALIEIFGSLCCCVSCINIYQYASNYWQWWHRMTVFIGLGSLYNGFNGFVVSNLGDYEVRKMVLLNVQGSIIHWSLFDMAVQARRLHKKYENDSRTQITRSDDDTLSDANEIRTNDVTDFMTDESLMI